METLLGLSLHGMPALVVGLGPVGRRRAIDLREAGARVVGVDPQAEQGDQGLEGIPIIRKPYCHQDLGQIRIVVAATGTDLDRAIAAEAERRGILANVPGNPQLGRLTWPASWRSGPVSLAVSTSGASPGLSALLRDRASKTIPAEAITLAEILQELRPLVLEQIPDPDRRRNLLRSWADPVWLTRIAKRGLKFADQLMRDQLQECRDDLS